MRSFITRQLLKLYSERKRNISLPRLLLFAEAVDYGQADIVFHGHAHAGVEKGETPGGTPVRNVAQPVIRHAFNIYMLESKKKKNDNNKEFLQLET